MGIKSLCEGLALQAEQLLKEADEYKEKGLYHPLHEFQEGCRLLAEKPISKPLRKSQKRRNKKLDKLTK